jgi:hypothetical protein
METPLEKLKKLTAWTTEPTLTEPELNEILSASALQDANGLAPLHENWTPTYNLNAAAATAWPIKPAEPPPRPTPTPNPSTSPQRSSTLAAALRNSTEPNPAPPCASHHLPLISNKTPARKKNV